MYHVVKRLIDIFLSVTVLLILLPVLLPIIFLLGISGDGDVFYFQERIGHKNKPFYIWKFATMIKNSLNIGLGGVTVKNDPRVTPIGRILRKTKINELPQVINILRGDMTLVGPRPLIMAGFLNYSEDMQNKIYNVKPGLTGIGSVIFRDEETLVSKSTDFKELYRRINSDKGQLELWYQENMSIKTDFLIVFLTAYSIFFPKQTLTYKVFKNLPQLEEIGEMEAVSSVTQVQRKVQQKNQVEKTENLSYK